MKGEESKRWIGLVCEPEVIVFSLSKSARVINASA